MKKFNHGLGRLPVITATRAEAISEIQQYIFLLELDVPAAAPAGRATSTAAPGGATTASTAAAGPETGKVWFEAA